MTTAADIDDVRRIGPQPGPQWDFLKCDANIGIYGGSAGGGKTYALLLDPLRWVQDYKDFGAVIFRRTSKQVFQEGGLWDTATDLYTSIGAEPRVSDAQFVFPKGARVTFAHMEHEKNRLDWQGAQIPVIGFDELTHFTWRQFSYMLSRNRSTCGVPPYIRATCNPDPDHWLRSFLAWWIDEKSGLAIRERAGRKRWFVMINDSPVWSDTRQELVDKFGEETQPRSVTFIPARLEDNPALTAADPNYLGNLMALPYVEREQLLGGNWNVRPIAGNMFRRSWFEIIDTLPAPLESVRAWDLAAGKKAHNDWTAGIKVCYHRSSGTFIVAHVERMKETPAQVDNAILRMAHQDGRATRIRLSEDPGQAGKAQAHQLIRMLAGFDVRARKETGDKVTRARMASAQAEAGNVKLLRGTWNDEFLNELENFPDPEDEHPDDQVDAFSNAVDELMHCMARPRMVAL